MRLRFSSGELAAKAEGVEEVSGGFRLWGREVRIYLPTLARAFYRHGWQSWSLASWVDLAEPLKPLLPLKRRPQADDPWLLSQKAYWGSGLGALRVEERVLLLGALGPGARVLGTEELLLGRSEGQEGWFVAFGKEEEVFAAYSRHLPRRLRGKPPRVWCSWYSFYRGITEELLLEVLEALEGYPFEVFQIDDGWQRALGDWEANEGFPRGMAYLAKRIREKGLRPGLWLAPFLVTEESPLYRSHPEWILRDPEGRPIPAGFNWGTPLYALDAGSPEVVDWVVSLVQKALAWGYEYLKLDFLYAAALPGAEGEGRYRKALEAVREAAGEAYLLLCGAPILASLGIADGLRVGPDVAPYWDNEDRSFWLADPTGPGLRNALRTTLHRLWLMENAHVDPDVVYFRTRYNLLSKEAMALQQAMAWITGFKATSDPPFWLLPEEAGALRRFLEEDPQVERLSTYRFRVGETTVDYGTVL